MAAAGVAPHTAPEVRAVFTIAGVPFGAVLSAGGVDACCPIAPGGAAGAGSAAGGAVSAFGIPAAEAAPLVYGTWVGAVDAGASINCPTLSACFHGVGTHTECCGHVLPGRVALGVDVALPTAPAVGLLLSVHAAVLPAAGAAVDEMRRTYPSAAPGDRVVTLAALQDALAAAAAALAPALPPAAPPARTVLEAAVAGGALVLRTLPNATTKRSASYSGTNPPYLAPEAAAWARAAGVVHLVLDLPSVDREDDGGACVSHRAFWGLPPRSDSAAIAALCAAGTLPQALVTELAFIPDAAPDGVLLLAPNIAPICMDAAPSRPVLYPAAPVAAAT